MQAKNMELDTKMKVKLLQIATEEWKRGRGFMRPVKERWIREYRDYSSTSMQKWRDFAATCCKREIFNLILVRQRNEVENNQNGQ